MSTLAFFVYGTPRPQGSKRHVGNGVMVESSNIGDWRHSVAGSAWAAANVSGWSMLDARCEVALTFYLQAPKSRTREYPTVKPDLDKLERAVLDALVTARIFRDDSRVTDLVGRKRYANDTQPLGCYIEVTSL